MGAANNATHAQSNTERTRWNVFETAIVITVLPEDDPKLKKIGIFGLHKDLMKINFVFVRRMYNLF